MTSTSTKPVENPNAKPVTVIKVGGAKLAAEDEIDALVDHVRRPGERGDRVVVVHGGGPEINTLHERLGVDTEKRDGIRVTRGEGMELAQMVLCGLVNKRVVARFLGGGVAAVGLSGVDGGLLTADLLDEELWGRVGREPRVDTRLLEELLAAGRVPVIAPISLGEDAAPVNVNADDAAHAIASALGVDSLDFISDIPGVKGAAGDVIARVDADGVTRLIADGVVVGGMVPKLEAALEALDAGVGRVRIGDLAAMDARTATEVTAATC